jgi:hypothetical protein
MRATPLERFLDLSNEKKEKRKNRIEKSIPRMNRISFDKNQRNCQMEKLEKNEKILI